MRRLRTNYRLGPDFSEAFNQSETGSFKSKKSKRPACDSLVDVNKMQVFVFWSCALPLIWHFFSNFFYLHFCLYIFFLYGSLVLRIYLDEITNCPTIWEQTGWKALEIRLPLNLLAYLQCRTPQRQKLLTVFMILPCKGPDGTLLLQPARPGHLALGHNPIAVPTGFCATELANISHCQ